MKNSLYLSLLMKSGFSPNFYCSQEYMEKAKIKEKIIGNYVVWEDKKWIVCPPIHKETGLVISGELPDWLENVWSDFEGWVMPGLTDWDFLDYEFIYDPKEFLDLSGGKWQVFRKNVRKFPKRYDLSGSLEYIDIFNLIRKMGKSYVNEEVMRVFVDWLEGKESFIFLGDDIATSYLLHGKNRKVLWDGEEILGINIWDDNHKYINFRFSFCLKEEYLSEYLRYLFYTDKDIVSQEKLVNDGGSLGNESLRLFKKKLNPFNIREVRSWKKI